MSGLMAAKTRWLAFLTAVAAVLSFAGASCLSTPGAENGDSDRPDEFVGDEDEDAECALPDEGCACSDGEAAPCGYVLGQVDDTLTCAYGTRRCVNGVFGACEREGTYEKELPPDTGTDYETKGLGKSQKCANNPCNPYCQNYVDDSKGMDAGADSGLKVTDAGITLKPNEAPPKVIYDGLQITPNPQNITVTKIFQSQHPQTNPATIQFKAQYTPLQNPPAYTPAVWSLSDYDNVLINGNGVLTVINPIPSKLTVKANASGFSATANATVKVDVLEADGVPQGVVDQFAQGVPPPPPPPPPEKKVAFEESFANNSKGWTVGSAMPITYFEENFNNNAKGWSLGPEWQIGAVKQSSGHSHYYPDPPSGNVAGVVLGGNASQSNHGYYYLTSPPIDTSDALTLYLDFDRWLNSYTGYTNTIDVYNGSTWVNLWTASVVGDSSWQHMQFNVLPYKANDMRVRFGFATNLPIGQCCQYQTQCCQYQTYCCQTQTHCCQYGTQCGYQWVYQYQYQYQCWYQYKCWWTWSWWGLQQVCGYQYTCGYGWGWGWGWAYKCWSVCTKNCTQCVKNCTQCVQNCQVCVQQCPVPKVSSWNIDNVKLSGTFREWEIGPAKASAPAAPGFNGDPGTDGTTNTGDNGVAGVRIGGNARTWPAHGYDYLTSPVINTAGLGNPVMLEFKRWLNSDVAPQMVNTVDVYNGSTWVNLWTSGAKIADGAWQSMALDVSSYKNQNMRVRFGYQTNGGSYSVGSWNLDDVAVTYVYQPPPPPAPTDTTSILYPYKDTVFPRALTPPVLQWAQTSPAASYVKYCLRFYDPAWGGQLTFRWCKISAEPNPTRATIPRWVWEPFETTASGQKAEIGLQRIVNGQVLPELVVPIRFSSEPMRGAIYFWEINNGRVARINEDGTLTKNALNSVQCNACHSVSASGNRVLTQLSGGNGPGALYDTAWNPAKQIYVRSGNVQFQAISPDGSMTLWEEDPARLSPSTSSAVVDTLWPAQAGRWIANPAWSPKGTYVAYASRTTSGWYVDYYASSLGIVQYNPNTQKFFNNKIILSTKAGWPVLTYPTFTPDEQYIVYQAANALRTRGNLGRLWMIRNDGANDTDLTKANGDGYLASWDLNVNYEPTFSPTTSGGFNWVVFVSNRTYGNTINKCNGAQKSCGKKQLWVSAVEASPVAGQDPSHPAFWLPGQETNNENMRGYFAKSPCKANGQDCKFHEDCCGYDKANPALSTAKCIINQPPTVPATRSCKPFNPFQCVKGGDPCASDQDCCNFPDVACIQGLCKSPAASQYVEAPFVRDYEAVCGPGEAPVWTLYLWKASTPDDSSIEFSAQTADTQGGLAGAPKVALATAKNQNNNWNFTDVGSKLPQGVSKKYLRITALLKPSSDGTLAPSLSDWTMQYDCIPSE